MINPYATHISDTPHPSLSPVVADRYGEVLVQYAADCVRVNTWQSNRRQYNYGGYLRQAFIREYTREA